MRKNPSFELTSQCVRRFHGYQLNHRGGQSTYEYRADLSISKHVNEKDSRSQWSDGRVTHLLLSSMTSPNNGVFVCLFVCLFLKKNQNAPSPSEHPPVRGEKMSKRLGGIKGCK